MSIEEEEEGQFGTKETCGIEDDQKSTDLTVDGKHSEFCEYVQDQLNYYRNGFEYEQLESDEEDLYKKDVDKPMTIEEVELIQKLASLNLKESKQLNDMEQQIQFDKLRLSDLIEEKKINQMNNSFQQMIQEPKRKTLAINYFYLQIYSRYPGETKNLSFRFGIAFNNLQDKF